MNYFDYEFRVRYGDTDRMGVSYYGNYFFWFEAARTEYFRALGFLYTDCEKKGFFLPVAEAGAKYLAPSTYDDLLVARTSVSEIRQSSLRFEYEICNKETQKKICTGFTRHVFVGKNLKPVRVPDEMRGVVTCFSLLRP